MSQENKHTLNSLQQEINQIQFPPRMNFSGIANELHLPEQNRSVLTKFRSPLLLTSVMLGLLLTIVSITNTFQWQFNIEPGLAVLQQNKPGILPILSTLLFLLPPFFSGYEELKKPHNNLFVILITIVLWLGQGLLWMFILLNLTDLTTWFVYSISGNLDNAILARMIFVFFIAMLWLSLLILTGEYHFKHLGEIDSWKSFGRSLLISGIAYSISVLFLQF